MKKLKYTKKPSATHRNANVHHNDTWRERLGTQLTQKVLLQNRKVRTVPRTYYCGRPFRAVLRRCVRLFLYFQPYRAPIRMNIGEKSNGVFFDTNCCLNRAFFAKLNLSYFPPSTSPPTHMMTRWTCLCFLGLNKRCVFCSWLWAAYLRPCVTFAFEQTFIMIGLQ